MDLFEGITIIDFESTSLDCDLAEVIEVGVSWFTGDDWSKAEQLYKPNSPIPPEISAKTFISNRMVKDKPNFQENIVDALELMRIEETNIYVAHNAQFDCILIRKQLEKQEIELPQITDMGNWICTLKWAQRLYGDKTDKSNLSFLRFFLDLDIPDMTPAHRAGDDALVTGKLFEKMFLDTLEQGFIDLESDVSVWDQIRQYYNQVIPYRTWPFGKHKGLPIEEVPKDYIEWAIQNIDSLDETSDKFDPRLGKTVEVIFS